MKSKKGQFWRDTVNGDILRLESFNLEANSNASPGAGGFVEYVRCACYVRGELFGTQEMKSSNLDGGRFVKVGLVKSLWCRWKFRTA